jgi:uncharacterized protein (DUF2237 family)
MKKTKKITRTHGQEAYDAGCAPPVVLEATHENVLMYGITLQQLEQHALAPRTY